MTTDSERIDELERQLAERTGQLEQVLHLAEESQKLAKRTAATAPKPEPAPVVRDQWGNVVDTADLDELGAEMIARFGTPTPERTPVEDMDPFSRSLHEHYGQRPPTEDEAGVTMLDEYERAARGTSGPNLTTLTAQEQADNGPKFAWGVGGWHPVRE